MATTLYDPASGWKSHILQARTDAAGSAVDDAGGEDLRTILDAFYTEGVVESLAFQVLEDSPAGMTVVIGSGSAKSDHAVIDGDVAGQGAYLVRMEDATVDLTVPAADLSNPRIDEVYLVVQDNAYDSSARVLPRIAYRDGTPAGSPSAPGPDPAWDAYLLVATIAVAANETEITNAEITDSRVFVESVVPVQDGVQEVDGSVGVASVTLTGSAADVASVVLAIPADWGSWKCYAEATYWIQRLTGNPFIYETQLRIDGVDQPRLKRVALGTTSENQAEDGAIAARRTGMTTTGNRTISLRAFRPAGTGSIEDIFLYARAVRTS